MTIRDRAERALMRAAAAVARDEWREGAYGSWARDGRQFTTTSAFVAFCNEAFSHDTPITASTANDVSKSGDVAEVAAWLAEQPESLRRLVEIRGHLVIGDGTPDQRLSFQFANRGLKHSRVHIGDLPQGVHWLAERAQRAVDHHTDPMTYRQRLRADPVIVPMTSHEAHSEKLRRALARKSATWGAAAGFVTGLGATLLDRLIFG